MAGAVRLRRAGKRGEGRDQRTCLGGLPFFGFAHCMVPQFGQDKTKSAGPLGLSSPTCATASTRNWQRARWRRRSPAMACASRTQRDRARDVPGRIQQGMSAPERARALGDERPEDWWWGGDGNVDAALILYAENDQDLLKQILRKRGSSRRTATWCCRTCRCKELPAGNVEPFRFKDGISQPIMRGSKHWSEPRYAMHVVEPGELVLGYRDNLGNVSPPPSNNGQDIGRNGTFLVMRQLEQHVARFNAYVEGEARRLVTDPRAPRFGRADLEHWVAARMVGRWRDGSSLVRHPHPPPSPKLGAASRPSDNEFSFGPEDPDGLRCPLGAHIRRANPRDSFEPGSPVQLAITNRHRMLRVGRVYKPERGKIPACCSCASTRTLKGSSSSFSRLGCSGRIFTDLRTRSTGCWIS